MICTENIHRITKYFLFSILILFHLCFAQDEIELNEENHENRFWKPTRRLLDSVGDSGTSNVQYALYFLAVASILMIGFCCQYCLQHGCQPMEYDYTNPMTPITPRRRRQNRLRSSFSRRRAPNPSSISSSSNSLSFEAGSLSRAQRGIENPSYNPSIQIQATGYQQPSAPQGLYSEPPLMDIPPSYETAVNIEQFPSPTNTGLAKVDEKRPLK